MTSDTYDTVTINIKSNIKLTNDTELNKIIETLTINGNGKTIDGNNKYQFLSIDSKSTVTINNIKIINCNATEGGSIYCNNLKLGITESQFINNKAEKGGAIYCINTKLTINSCKFINNKATTNGGAINNIGSESSLYYEPKISNNTFQNNSAEYGGAIYNSQSDLIVNNNTFINNQATYGGAIENVGRNFRYGYTYYYNWGLSQRTNYETIHRSNMNITNNIFKSNSATYGGAIDTYITRDPVVSYAYAGAFYSNDKGLQINNNNFIENNASQLGGAINCRSGNDTYMNYNNFTRNTANRNGGAIYINKNSEYWIYIQHSNFTKNRGINGPAIYTLADNAHILYNNFTQNELINSTLKSHEAIYEAKNNELTVSNNIKSNETNYPKVIYLYGNAYIQYNNFDDGIKNVKITLQPVKGIIGEIITLQATLKDTDNLPVTGGNLAFKLNGKTLRNDGRFDSNAPTMKFSVKNGIVTYTIKADLYLRNAKNLTASYSGTSKYYENTSPSVTAQIQKRNAQITVTTTPTKAKQYETLTFKITAKDTTKNGKNNTLIYTDTKVMLKVNGVTLKDSKGKPVYVTLDKNAQATYNYTIPAGTGGITTSKATRNYKVEAIFVGDNYYPGARNSTSFQVERSPTNVYIHELGISPSKLIINATLKDYKGNYLIGTNKVAVKINGKSYTKNGKPVYWSVKNGIVDIDLEVDPNTTIKRVMVVTGERQAYLEGRTERIV